MYGMLISGTMLPHKNARLYTAVRSRALGEFFQLGVV
jgi:hypothetical protein